MSQDDQVLLTLVVCFCLLPAVAILAGMWATFRKAGLPSWTILVPVYNAVQLCRIAGKPAVWCVLLLVPIVNVFALLEIFSGLGKNFGKGPNFSLGLLFLGFAYWPMLGFDESKYRGPALT